MNNTVTQLYPVEQISEQPFNNLYLAHNIRQHEGTFVYANFISSIDGRIAIPHPTRDGLTVPTAITNERDWRLFQELVAQADIIISSGRYLRDYADGRAQELLQTDDPRFADLRDWRQEQGLSPQPDIAIISRSLDFPIPELLTSDGRRVLIFTTANPDPARVAEIEAKAGQLFIVGEDSVDGVQMIEQLTKAGYRTIYSAAGPRILHLLLTSHCLNRLYLTQANKLLGGRPFSSIVDGTLFPQGIQLDLHHIYLDQADFGQLLLSYNIK